MKMPIEPLTSLEKLPVQSNEVRQTEPVMAARGIGAEAPSIPFGMPSPNRRPSAEATATNPDEAPAYSGEERRKGERRGDGKPALLDTRVRRDRRRRNSQAGVDLKV
jgi:hypothetical protein